MNQVTCPIPKRHTWAAFREQLCHRLFAVVRVLTIVVIAWTLFGCGQSGSSKAPKKGIPKITAEPNPVPAGSGEGTTTISWNTGDGSIGEVYVVCNNGSEKLFFREAQGSREAPWVNAGAVYEFRLYRGTNLEELLASVSVTKEKE